MADVIQLRQEELLEAVAEWRADVPGPLVYPSLPAATDPATAAVCAALAPWAANFAALDAERAALASKMVEAASAAQSILCCADEAGAADIGKSTAV
ncbi:hypothetical protein [Mycobacteroides abscessus]|uniref:hypothetical protein n=1 Tax=Mycobacteroides abscessus TaxID=36809 RepID=UPI0009277F15|nr:hypothetical protein [Mycobacteroides abscessus]SHP44629.1 Uncharacterised protein [Mycobacteroides abscessus subsp. abscessus]SHQ50684.1 Uncharacterised protein [Mycobacteroides abscessus subsp. abscessus]SHQ52024.1 Uncharacterised protein [Mycobacteroides abscessus subsp. abscessus]SHS76691.1 Uncharacterised protein [Mycobacteroides abscessus subsp. abscessus]SHT52752.1 Uncharacterised protein [Mycobacteroides abscessus subsp. abscessus]